MPNLASIRKQMAEVQKAIRAELCTCGKSGGTPTLDLGFIRTCAQEREWEARKARERCPAMHPDGDVEPLEIGIALSFCEDFACDCHQAADHGTCPTCDSHYFEKRLALPRSTEPSDLNSHGGSSTLRPISTTEPMPVPARDVVAVMRREAVPTPALPAPTMLDPQPAAPRAFPGLYRRDPSRLPACPCGHPAQWHHEFRAMQTCADCGRSVEEHDDPDVLHLGGPRSCRFVPRSTGCVVVGPSPCGCDGYRETA